MLPTGQKRKKLTLHNRPHLVVEALQEANEELQPVFRMAKYEKMASSPYAFFRGAAHLYWADFFRDWWFSLFGGKPQTQTWIQGDAHVYNMGAFGDHQGNVLFGLDDFDDAIVSDYQYDLWRFAASIVLDARQNAGFPSAVIGRALDTFAKAYLHTVTAFSREELHKPQAFTKKEAKGPLEDFLKKVEKKETRRKMLDKWTVLSGGERIFDTDKEKLALITQKERTALLEAFAEYRATLETHLEDQDDAHFKVKDMAKRLWAGTGSLGSPRFYILLEGDEETQHDDIILDIKRQERPAAYPFMNASEKEAYHEVFAHEGERHAEAFRGLSERTDRYLGWLTLLDEVYSVRERSPFKEDYPTHKLDSEKAFQSLAKQWGKILATAHKQSGHWLNRENDPFLFEKTLAEITAGQEKAFVELLGQIAFSYADCVTQDYQTFLHSSLE
jgi:uncharacterized protein (DUF2252 family)